MSSFQTPPPTPAPNQPAPTEDRLIGHQVIRLDRVGSTNDVLRDLLRTGEPREGTVVVAREQTAGRGRLGREWRSPPGGLWCSVLIRPAGPTDVRLGLLAAVAAALGARAATGADVRIKWPNDLILAGRKVGGVLVEAVPPWAIVGIGLNVDVDVRQLPQAVAARAASLAETSRGAEPGEVLTALLNILEVLYAAWRAGDRDAWRDGWMALNVTLGRRIALALGADIVSGTAVELDRDGALLVDTGGAIRRVTTGDVTILDSAT